MRSKNDDLQLELWARLSMDDSPPRVGLADTPSSQRPRQGLLFDDDDAATPPARVLHSSFADTHPLSILVADDNEINRKVIRVILQKLGYQCNEADDGQKALRLYRKKAHDYIFMDIDMPEMDGLEATREIRKAEASPAEIIAVTANVSDETRLKCRRAGMNGYLEKPITAEMVKEQLLRSWPRIRAKRKAG